MLHYLPDVFTFFQEFPLQRLFMSTQPFLQNTIPDVHSIDDSAKPQVTETSTNFWHRRKSGGAQKQLSPKLKEIQYLLPYLMLNLDYEISTAAMREVQKLIVHGSFKTRAALVDQILYMIKELMLETPEDFLISQSLLVLIKIIKIWHTSEKIKVKVSSELAKKTQIEGQDIVSTDLYGSYYF